VSTTDPGSSDFVSVFSASTRRPCDERSLVLKAMNIDHLVVERIDGCHLLVPVNEITRARRELALYAAENSQPRAAPLPLPPVDRGLTAALAFPLSILVMFLIEANYAFGRDWISAGESAAGRVWAGEWWRVITALTLHADLAHVVGNAVFGAFFAYLAGQYLGSGAALLELTLAGAAGNAANAFLQTPDHRSIGASTAVFAALGIVAVHAWIDRRGWARGWARRSAPLVGAVALLTYLGTGDGQTDVVAHLTGFLMGACGGFLVAHGTHRVTRPRTLDAGLGVAAGLLIAIAWAFALYAPTGLTE
jgi:membrane associated rhomboid family serine protease